MGAISLEPIIEIFIEETESLLDELKETKNAAVERGGYTKDDVAEIFRITHTFKADATMVLYENLAELGRTFEKLLYYFRDEKPEDLDLERFTGLIDNVYDFVATEVDKVSSGHEPDASSLELCNSIKEYLKSLKGMNIEVEPAKPELDQKYYISPKSAREPEPETPPPVNPGEYKVDKRKPQGVTKREKSLYEMQHRSQNFSISDESMSTLYTLRNELSEYVEEFNISSHSKLGKIAAGFEEWIDKECISDFSSVVLKIEKIVEEMRERTGKNVTVKVSGAETKIEKYKVNVISGAIVHLIRNAVDHGIEGSVDRVMAGKSKDGHIDVNIVKDLNESNIIVTVADDGMGVDTELVLRKAERKQMLQKDKDLYTEEEILDFILTPGFSTLDKVGEYSGRGVGMDVVKSNIEELDGRISLFSTFGEGFHISLIIPTNV